MILRFQTLFKIRSVFWKETPHLFKCRVVSKCGVSCVDLNIDFLFGTISIMQVVMKN